MAGEIAIDKQSPAIRSCLWSSDVTALVAHPRTYSVQIGGPGSPSSARQRSRPPRTVHLAVQHAESIITPFFIIQPSSRPASSSLDCWCKGVSGAEPALWNSLPADITRLTVCQIFVIVLKIICSLIRIQALFNNCTIFYRDLEAFYIALGHVNPIENYYYYNLMILISPWRQKFSFI